MDQPPLEISRCNSEASLAKSNSGGKTLELWLGGQKWVSLGAGQRLSENARKAMGKEDDQVAYLLR
jgi:hypothetical protein